MSTFQNYMFAFKDAYSFKLDTNKSVEEVLLQELIYQLSDLEDLWVQLEVKKEDTRQYHLNRIQFRLEEINRFLTDYSGPRIIRYICSEISDFLIEQEQQGKIIDPIMEQGVAHILVVMNGFFHPEVYPLQLTTIDEVAGHLKKSMEILLNRYTETDQQKSLQSLQSLKSGKKKKERKERKQKKEKKHD
ncbi:MAG: hypothetical protein COB67_08540 [SAR324 cluster bacterium]|uniref:Uncharacterized protein n=1 Tax=SAR324 cluster bacterium TaxID=2024889 RepID=A0A2A4T1H4_9DELT|nr:MAG: hypothetical protein COB67_08540 [SAR324 cluster bacterium]